MEFVHFLCHPSVGLESLLYAVVACYKTVDVDKFHPRVKLAGYRNEGHVDGAADELFIYKGIVSELVCGENFDVDASVALRGNFLRNFFHESRRSMIGRELTGKTQVHFCCRCCRCHCDQYHHHC